ncbi:protein-disulfide reductase DsbD domain-containing protein, partial [Acinetobacter baumannii]
HINAAYPQEGRIPTAVEVSTDLPVQIGEPIWMPPQRIQSGSEPIEVYYEQAVALLPITAVNASDATDGYVRILVRYQPCTETECGLPVERVF